MNRFYVEECEILWIKKHKIPERDKQAIKSDLSGMSILIGEALNYSKERAHRWTEVSFQLNTESDAQSYYLKIRYEPVAEGWIIEIEAIDNYRIDFPRKVIGEIVSEKWSLLKMFSDENYEAPEKIKT